MHGRQGMQGVVVGAHTVVSVVVAWLGLWLASGLRAKLLPAGAGASCDQAAHSYKHTESVASGSHIHKHVNLLGAFNLPNAMNEQIRMTHPGADVDRPSRRPCH